MENPYMVKKLKEEIVDKQTLSMRCLSKGVHV